MASEHVPSVKEQTDLFRMRSTARTAEVERRSQVNQTLDLAQAQLEQQKLEDEAELLKNGDRWIRNSEDTIFRLVKQNAALSRAFSRMTEAWGPKDQDAMAVANGMIEEMVKDLEKDPEFIANAKRWGKTRIKDGASFPNPTVRKPRKP